jgi:hypothetical protein
MMKSTACFVLCIICSVCLVVPCEATDLPELCRLAEHHMHDLMNCCKRSQASLTNSERNDCMDKLCDRFREGVGTELYKFDRGGEIVDLISSDFYGSLYSCCVLGSQAHCQKVRSLHRHIIGILQQMSYGAKPPN